QMLLDEAANRLNAIGLRVAADRSRAAPQAGAIAALLRRIGREKELNILAPRTKAGNTPRYWRPRKQTHRHRRNRARPPHSSAGRLNLRCSIQLRSCPQRLEPVWI